MSSRVFDPEPPRRSRRVPFAILLSLVSVTLIVAALLDTRRPAIPPKPQPAAEPEPKPEAPSHYALGPAVVAAPELGLEVSAPNQAAVDPDAVTRRIEAQLLDLRRLYRDRSEADPSLVGVHFLRLTLDAQGKPDPVTEAKSQLKDREFRDAVLAAVRAWDLSDLGPAGTTILCPLLFVRQGMDIVTVKNWEKAVGVKPEAPAPPAKTQSKPRKQRK